MIDVNSSLYLLKLIVAVGEDTGVASYSKKIEELVIFHWNRKYPGDRKLDFIPQENGMKLVVSEDFTGNSHEKITMEVWR